MKICCFHEIDFKGMSCLKFMANIFDTVAQIDPGEGGNLYPFMPYGISRPFQFAEFSVVRE